MQGRKTGKEIYISYKPLRHTLIERNMRKEDLRLVAGLTTNIIANMSKEGITENGIDYILVGDYYIPDLKLPDENRIF